MLAITVGLTGVGKTTVINLASELGDVDFQTVSYGDIILELAKERDLAENRDEITDIPPEEYSELQDEVPRRIKKKSKQKPTVLDTHAALNTPSGYRPGLPKNTVEILEPDTIIFIKATPVEIQRRRTTDESRDRERMAKEELREQQEVAIQMATTSAVLAGCTFNIIENKSDKDSKNSVGSTTPSGKKVAAEKFVKILKEASN